MPADPVPLARPTSARQAVARVRQATGLLRSVLSAAPPDGVSGPEAAGLAEVFAQAERVAAAATALYARTVAATASHRATGQPDAGHWLAAIAGTPVARARSALRAADALASSPEAARAFAHGELSLPQAEVVGGAAALSPGVAAELLHAARHGSFRELRDKAETATRALRGEATEQAKEARAHARRYCRTWTPGDGGLRLEALLTKKDGARLLAHLERLADVAFAEGHAAGEAEPHERYLADALVRLGLAGSAGTTPGRTPAAHVAVRVDATALRRGSVAPGEVCEIAGVGPVPVATARDLLGDAFFTVLVTDGVDVTTVTSTKRTIPRALRLALEERDRTCVVPGCPAGDHLEIDHWRLDFARGGPTSLDNLARLCGRHHAMKTASGWRLAGGPGRWRWLPPRRAGPPPATGPPGG